MKPLILLLRVKSITLSILRAQGQALRWDLPSADVIVQGDKHVYGAAEVTAFKFEYDAGLRPSPFVWLVQVGTAKAGPDKYSIRRWSQGVFEWPIAVFWPDEHKIKVTRHLEDVEAWLGEKDFG